MGGSRFRGRTDEMMLPDGGDGTRLRPVRAFAFGDHQPDFLPDLELVETFTSDAISVEIDFLRDPAFGCDEAVALIGKQPDDLSVKRHHMRFDIAAESPGMILQRSCRGVEGIANCDIDIFMGMILRPFAR